MIIPCHYTDTKIHVTVGAWTNSYLYFFVLLEWRKWWWQLAQCPWGGWKALFPAPAGLAALAVSVYNLYTMCQLLCCYNRHLWYFSGYIPPQKVNLWYSTDGGQVRVCLYEQTVSKENSINARKYVYIILNCVLHKRAYHRNVWISSSHKKMRICLFLY